LLRRIAAALQMQRFITEEFQPGLTVTSYEERLDYARRRGRGVPPGALAKAHADLAAA
jgi:hypothetical protein